MVFLEFDALPEKDIKFGIRLAGAFAATILAGGVLFYALSSSRGPDILGARHICSVFGIGIP